MNGVDHMATGVCVSLPVHTPGPVHQVAQLGSLVFSLETEQTYFHPVDIVTASTRTHATLQKARGHPDNVQSFSMKTQDFRNDSQC